MRERGGEENSSFNLYDRSVCARRLHVRNALAETEMGKEREEGRKQSDKDRKERGKTAVFA